MMRQDPHKRHRKKQVGRNKTLALADRAATEMITGAAIASDMAVNEARNWSIENKL